MNIFIRIHRNVHTVLHRKIVTSRTCYEKEFFRFTENFPSQFSAFELSQKCIKKRTGITVAERLPPVHLFHFVYFFGPFFLFSCPALYYISRFFFSSAFTVVVHCCPPSRRFSLLIHRTTSFVSCRHCTPQRPGRYQQKNVV